MKKFFLIFSVVSCILFAALYFLESPPAQIKRAEAHSLVWEDCWFPTPLLRPIHCGFLNLDSETKIPVVVVRRSFFQRDLKPLLFIDGGPGSPSILQGGTIDGWLDWLKNLQIDRDLVLFDYLGTGLSKPSYQCTDFTSISESVLAKNMSFVDEVQAYNPKVVECYKKLARQGLDLSKLTLPYHVEYLKKILQSIPDAQWDVYGASYGTRVILAMLRFSTPNLQKVVLDGVFPLDVDMWLEEPKLLGKAFKKLFYGCERQWSCHHEFPSLEKKFYSYVKELNYSPLKFIIKHPRANKEVNLVINGQRLMALVFQSMYRWDYIEKLPHALSSAIEGNPVYLRPMVEGFSWYYLDNEWSVPLSTSSICSERRSSTTKDALRSVVKEYPRLVDYFEARLRNDVCDVWVVSRVPDKNFKPIQSNKSILIFSDWYDPITPPDWARTARKNLPNSYLFEFSGIGHGVVNSDICAQELMRKFLHDERDLGSTKCALDSQGPVFYTDEKKEST